MREKVSKRDTEAEQPVVVMNLVKARGAKGLRPSALSVRQLETGGTRG